MPRKKGKDLNKITKRELIRTIVNELVEKEDLSIKDAKRITYQVIDSLFENVKNNALQGKKTEITGWGMFYPKTTLYRPGWMLDRPAKQVTLIRFKPGKRLKEARP